MQGVHKPQETTCMFWYRPVTIQCGEEFLMFKLGVLTIDQPVDSASVGREHVSMTDE